MGKREHNKMDQQAVTWAVQTASGLPEITSRENAYRWMRESTGLKIETEPLITAAQDQALDTKCHKPKILHMPNYPKCRFCKEKDETVARTVSACPKIAGSLYKTTHNNVAAAIHPPQHMPVLRDQKDR